MALQPGEDFSFYKEVGPYAANNGCAYFENIIGNIMCQVVILMRKCLMF